MRSNAVIPEESYEVADNGCWIWQRAKSKAGYSQIYEDGKKIYGHRWFYEKYEGRIPENKEIDHLCGNKACVNPDHLEPVSTAQNVRRGATSKLSMELAEEIRRRYDREDITQKELAEDYGIDDSNICRVINQEIWIQS